MFKILICEESLSFLAPTLFSNYDYDIAKNTDEIINFTFQKDYDLYLFHIECFNSRKELKETGDTTPTIFIDEYYSLHNFKKALSVGDDYILKPLYVEELSIRVHYHYSKIYNCCDKTIIYKNFYFHTNTQQLFENTTKIKLSPNELKLVALFFTHINKPLSKDIIYEVLQSDSNGSLRVYISKLKKLGLEINYERSLLSYTLSTLNPIK
jgi:DNA-binding response OmpR family regulator